MRKLLYAIPLILITLIILIFSIRRENYSTSAGIYPGTVSNIGTLSFPAPTQLNILVSDTNGNVQTKLITDVAQPPGAIIMWAGATNAIPAGWVFCDGTSYSQTSMGNWSPDSAGTFNTPDLRSSFIVGSSAPNTQQTTNTVFNVGDMGGEQAHQLTLTELPPHSHYFPVGQSKCPTKDFGAHPSEVQYMDGGWTRWLTNNTTYGPWNQTGFSAFPVLTVTGGNPQTSANPLGSPLIAPSVPTTEFHNNMPPFYALAFIIKLPY